MKSFEKFWFTPPYQQKDKPTVEFELRPLDQRTLYIIASDHSRSGVGPDGALAAFEYGVTNWRGLDVEFSHEAKRLVLNGKGEIRWAVWFSEIAGELYKRAIFGDAAAKNS